MDVIPLALVESRGEEIQTQCLNLFDYKYEKSYIYIDQVVDTKFTLLNDRGEKRRQQAVPMRRIVSH